MTFDFTKLLTFYHTKFDKLFLETIDRIILKWQYIQSSPHLAEAEKREYQVIELYKATITEAMEVTTCLKFHKGDLSFHTVLKVNQPTCLALQDKTFLAKEYDCVERDAIIVGSLWEETRGT